MSSLPFSSTFNYDQQGLSLISCLKIAGVHFITSSIFVNTKKAVTIELIKLRSAVEEYRVNMVQLNCNLIDQHY